MESERILLRNIEEKDAEAIFAYRSLPEVARYQYWEPFTREEISLFIQQYSRPGFDVDGKWNALGIIHKKDHILIGDCSLRLVANQAEIGCIIAPEYQHQGFANEALRLLIDNCFKNMPVDGVYGITDSENTASIRMMESINMMKSSDFEERMICKGLLSIEHQYTIKKADWYRYKDQ